MNLKNPLFKSNYHNCSQLVTAAMLSRHKIPVEQIWKQAGLIFGNTDNELILMSSFRILAEDIYKYNGIKLEKNSYPYGDYEEYVKKVFEENILDTTFAASLDVFELPYCHYYQREHEYHIVEVIKAEEDDLIICDHFYHYYGKLSKAQFKKAAYSVYKNTARQENVYKFIKEVNFKNEVDIVSVLDENLKAMEGHTIQLEFEDTMVGLQSIPHMKEHFMQIFKEDFNTARPVLDGYFTGLKDIANSRYHLATFLKSFDDKEESKALIESYQDAYQCWAVLANLIARMFVSKRLDGMEERVSKRFDKAYELEKIVVKELKNYLHVLSTSHL
ncbi:hypothetical protein [Bacillus cereus group sp. N21]|uniref:hypothetical protein n=1 Tax=Bacillus cereus group sp. N21 TaxID=2794591 RepID=UPI0018F59344|nr:hypothetical protein [Bacillus cereus group sp. N21]MBJ8030424.1 hypothetical protein [Bacillus cereus group sp. N21]